MLQESEYYTVARSSQRISLFGGVEEASVPTLHGAYDRDDCDDI
jgi:hypothetical protein